MTENMHITASPLTWPTGWPRTRTPERSRFGKWNAPVSIARATEEVLEELRRMGFPDFSVIISTNLRLRQDGLPYSNQRQPDDKGAAVWWKDGKEQYVIALDKYDRIGDNLHAIAKTIEAMRGIERWGGGEILSRTFTGFTALPWPDSANANHWRQVLDYYGDSLSDAKDAYLFIRSQAHPDKGGTENTFNLVQRAWEDAKRELG